MLLQQLLLVLLVVPGCWEGWSLGDDDDTGALDGTDTDGDNNHEDDIQYQGGPALNFDQSETFVCNVDGCQ